jgi:ferric-dicitrate binding protein FerR (iron transport regulator)
MKHHDLWNDSLDEAMPRDLASASLKAMQSAARGRKRRRRLAGAALLGLACAAGALVFWPSPRTKQPEPPAVAIAAIAPVRPVRYLSDNELIEHLNAAGYGVAITQNGGHERMLLVPQVVRVVRGRR